MPVLCPNKLSGVRAIVAEELISSIRTKSTRKHTRATATGTFITFIISKRYAEKFRYELPLRPKRWCFDRFNAGKGTVMKAELYILQKKLPRNYNQGFKSQGHSSTEAFMSDFYQYCFRTHLSTSPCRVFPGD